MSKHSESPDGSKAENLEPITMIFAGHRGFGASQVQNQKEEHLRLPENSLISIQEVMKSGAESIEFDLYLSSDGHLMVIHDDDLSINAHYIVQHENEMARPDGSGFFPIGDTTAFPPNRTFVSKLPSNFLRQAFDISKNLPIPGDCPLEARFLYSRIPEYSEILEFVSVENAKRAETGQPRIKLNVELKGPGTGAHVQKALNDFNAAKQEGQRIRQEEIYYMSFRAEELAVIAGLTHQADVVPCSNANLILGVPTAVQYLKIGPGYSIEDSGLNHDALSKNVLLLHQALMKTPERKGMGLSGVDMSLWDVSESSIDYFCKAHKLPIHIAVVPFGPNDLRAEHINPALINIELVAKAQSAYLVPDQVMIVKTDNPTLLKQMVWEMGKSQEPVILSVAVKKRGYQAQEQAFGKHGIRLFTKPGTENEPPQPFVEDRSWWGEEQIIPALQRFTNSHITNTVVAADGLAVAFDDISRNNGSGIIPLNVNVITGEFGNHRNHWVGLQLIGGADGQTTEINYVDPMGRSINDQIKQQIQEKFGPDIQINEPLLGKAIQNAKIVSIKETPTEAPVLVCRGNDYDCGPMLTHAMIYLDKNIELPNMPLSALESRKLGQEIRQQVAKNIGIQVDQADHPVKTTRDRTIKKAKIIGTKIKKDTQEKKGTSPATATHTINKQKSGQDSGRF